MNLENEIKEIKEIKELKNIVLQQALELQKQRKIIQLLHERLADLADDFDRLDDSPFHCYRRTQDWKN